MCPWQGHRGDKKKKQNLLKAIKPKAEPGHYIDNQWPGKATGETKKKKVKNP